MEDKRQQESDRAFADMVRWLTEEFHRTKKSRSYGAFGCRFEVKDGEIIRRHKIQEEALKGN